MTPIEPAESTVPPPSDPEYEEITVPVLVVGAGAAGARTAIELAERDVDCLVVGKSEHGDAHTTWAAGGINAALGSLDPEDDWTIHAADTYREGHFVNNPDGVELVAKYMPDRIRELDEWGVPFNRTEDGAIDQRYFGAQSFRRTCFVGDKTGEAILDALIDRARALDVPYRENVLVTRLLSDGERVYGAVAVDAESGRNLLFAANHVVLAAGGSSALYARHSSRVDENNGDGPALAYDAGATLVDMEFFQFHPTGMVQHPEWDEDWSGRLVTEAVRGEGGRLFNVDGERFMERYSPTKMELDARDVVARAIAREIREGRGTERGGVYLDISHRDRDFIEARLPRMYERFAGLGIDMAEEPVEVAPTAHYSMGGVDIDFHTGETGIERLYAVGETTGGVHGANRLGGNSLAETVAIAPLVGEHVAATFDGSPPTLPEDVREFAEREFAALDALATADGDVSPGELGAEFGSLFWEHAGILRDGERLDEGLRELLALRERMADLRVEGGKTGWDFEYAVDLAFMFTVGEAVLRGAALRAESRGAHYRTDRPETSSQWRRNVLVRRGADGMTVDARPAGRPSQAVQEALDAGYELQYSHVE